MIRFVKMSGAGNDFILLQGKVLSPARLARRLCPRRTSVGADGIIVLRGLSFRYYNSDGSRAFCANGCRCAAWYAYKSGRAGRRFALRTDAGPVECRVTGQERVRIGMPGSRLLRSLRAQGMDVRLLHTGVPHAVVRVRGLARLDVRGLGRSLRRDPAFGPGGANVDFFSVSRGRTALRTYERGVEDETLACGTGAVAVALACGRPSPVRMEAVGGSFTVGFKPLGDGRFADVWLEGPAKVVFEGVLS